ncbi:MAG: TolC family protein [Chthonomonadales bacterium]
MLCLPGARATRRPLIHRLRNPGRLILLAGAMLMGGCTAVSAQPTQREEAVLTLQAAINGALQNAPVILAAEREVAAGRQQVNSVRGLAYGELDALVTAQHLNDAQLLRPLAGPISASSMATAPFAQDQLHAGAVYTFPLYDGRQIANRILIAELSEAKARSFLKGTRADVTYNVTALYVQAQALRAQADALTAEIEELDTTRKNTELAVKIGKRADVELLKIVDRVREAEAAREAVLAQRRRVVATLLAVMGRDPAGAPKLAPLPEELPSVRMAFQDLEAAAARRTSVTVAQLTVRQGERNVSLARGSLEPVISLQTSYLRHFDAAYPDNSRETWFVGMAVSMPLLDWGVRRAALSKSREETQAAKAQADGARLQAMADLQAALAAWDAAKKQLDAANAQYDAAREVARIEQLRYDTGAGDIEDLLRARTREAAARTAQANAKALVLVSGAQINHVTEQEAVR